MGANRGGGYSGRRTNGRGRGHPSLFNNNGCPQLAELTDQVLNAEVDKLEVLITNTSPKPRERAFTVLINKTGKQKQVQKAEEIFKIMQRGEFNYPPTAWSYTALLSAYDRADELQKFEALLDQMLKAAKEDPGCTPTAVTWFTVLSMYEKAGLWEKALSLFEDKVKNSEESASGWFAIIDGYIKRGEYLKALSLLDEAHQRGFPKPQGPPGGRTEVDRGMQRESTYCRLLEYLLSERRYSDATELFLAMQMAGVEATSASIKALLKSAASVAHFALPLYESYLHESSKWSHERRADVWRALCQGVQYNESVVRQMAKVLSTLPGASPDLAMYKGDLGSLMQAANISNHV
eukprot:jgi/Botrbrau1/23559/Bobra.0141s0029.1